MLCCLPLTEEARQEGTCLSLLLHKCCGIVASVYFHMSKNKIANTLKTENNGIAKSSLNNFDKKYPYFSNCFKNFTRSGYWLNPKYRVQIYSFVCHWFCERAAKYEFDSKEKCYDCFSKKRNIETQMMN